MSCSPDCTVNESDECKWDYFRKLRDLDDDEVNENDENLRKYINDIDQSQSSLLSDEMNAMERTLRLSRLRDTISENIVNKISDPKDRMLVSLLYKVCTDIDPTRMQFIRFCVALKNHGILNDLNFLEMNPTHLSINHTHTDMEFEYGNNQEWTEQWSETENEKYESDSEHSHISQSDIESIENIENIQNLKIETGNETETENMNDLPLIRLMSFKKMNENINAKNNGIISRYNRDFEEMECIGYGAFGCVYRCKHKLDLGIYAIKKIVYKHHGLNHKNIKSQIIREIQNIARLNHTNIVRYYCAWIENGPIITNNTNTNTTKTDAHSGDNVMSFHSYVQKHDLGMAKGNNLLNPSGSIPIIRAKSNEGMSLLLSSDTQKSLMSPYPSRHTSPTPVLTHNSGNIMRYWENQTSYACLYLQTEYCGKYTLNDFINDPNRVPNRDEHMHIFSQILLGLAHIHSKRLLHRDLKPANMFLQRKNGGFRVLIGDFGLSKSLTDNITMSQSPSHEFVSENGHNSFTTDIGTDTYGAPEQLSNKNEQKMCGYAADIYSLGIILFELIQPAFDTMMERRIAISKFRNKGEIDLDRIDQIKFGKEIDLMRQMTQKRAELRPTAHSLILNEDIQIYWMQNILNDAMPHSLPSSPQKSLEYENEKNESFEISIVTEKDSPTFLLTSPKAPPLLIPFLDMMDEK